MKHLFYLFTIVLLTACNSNDDNGKPEGFNIDTSINISYFSKDSLDLLDQEKDFTYQEKDIELFYLDNNKKIKIFEDKLTYPKGFKIFEHEIDSVYRISIFGKTNQSKAKDTMLIKLNETDTDTIVYTTRYTNNIEEITKVWYNGVIKWEVPYVEERYFTIIKN